MVSVAKDDHNILRFLWIDDVSRENPEVVTFIFTRVVFGISSSPYNVTIRYHFEAHIENHPIVVRLLKSLYVITSASTEDEAFSFYRVAKGILKAGGLIIESYCAACRV